MTEPTDDSATVPGRTPQVASGARPPEVVVLGGGLGTSRLATGLRALGLLGSSLLVVNVADDRSFYGLHVAPDVDTVLYTLADMLDRRRGWGLAGDTARVMEALAALGAEPWFHLGDRDLATHLFRTALLADGMRLSAVVARLCDALGLPPVVRPASDQLVRTRVTVAGGEEVDFQTFHVRLGAGPTVTSVRYDGLEGALPAPGVLDALGRAGVVVVAPSSPVASVLPILGLAGVRQALTDRSGPTVAISPLVLAATPDEATRRRVATSRRLLEGVGVEPSPWGVAGCYADLVDAFVVDQRDRPQPGAGMPAATETLFADTITPTPERAAGLLASVLSWAGRVDVPPPPLSRPPRGRPAAGRTGARPR